MRRRPSLFLAATLVLLLAVCLACGCSSTAAPASGANGSEAGSSAGGNDAVFAHAFSQHSSGLEVEGQGTVVRLLSDDTEGERHQRFIVQLVSGQTLLVAHNIDVAPRVAPLQVGDTVSFKGVYEWNEQGGLVHWTHLDPSGSHEPGWIKCNRRTYE